MRKEDYNRLLGAALALGVLILVAFQLYLNREPGRAGCRSGRSGCRRSGALPG